MFSVTMLSLTVTLYCFPPISATAKTVAGANPAASELMARFAASPPHLNRAAAAGRLDIATARSGGKADAGGSVAHRRVPNAARAAGHSASTAATAPRPRSADAAKALTQACIRQGGVEVQNHFSGAEHFLTGRK